MQVEQDELNRVKDFDLDAYLDGVEPTQRVQTVNTRGDLLAKYANVQEQRRAALQRLEQLAGELPGDDESDAAETLASGAEDDARAEFDTLRAEIAKLETQAAAISAEYASHKVRVTFKVPDKSTRARVTSEANLQDHKPSSHSDDTMLRLMRAAVVEIVVVDAGQEIPQNLDAWNVARWSKFLDRIGDGQTRLLMDAYLGLASGEVTPPFSLVS